MFLNLNGAEKCAEIWWKIANEMNSFSRCEQPHSRRLEFGLQKWEHTTKISEDVDLNRIHLVFAEVPLYSVVAALGSRAHTHKHTHTEGKLYKVTCCIHSFHDGTHVLDNLAQTHQEGEIERQLTANSSAAESSSSPGYEVILTASSFSFLRFSSTSLPF